MFFEKLKYGKIERKNNISEYREFQSLEDVEKWGKKVYGEWTKKYLELKNQLWMSGLTKEEKRTFNPIEYYCGWGYKSINSYLRNGEHAYSEKDIAKTNELALCMLSAPRIPENIIVYRCVDEYYIEKLIKANRDNSSEYLEKGYLSTSLLKNICQDKDYEQRKYLLKIYVDEGTVGIFPGLICGRRNENEIILRNNMFMKMCGIPYIDKEMNKLVFECSVSTIYRV